MPNQASPSRPAAFASVSGGAHGHQPPASRYVVMPPAAVVRREQRAANEQAARDFLQAVINGQLTVISNHYILRSRVSDDATRPRWAPRARRQSAAVQVQFGELATIERLEIMLKQGQLRVNGLTEFMRQARRWLNHLHISRINTAIDRYRAIEQSRDSHEELLRILGNPGCWSELAACEVIAQAVANGLMAKLYSSSRITNETYFELIARSFMGRDCQPVYRPDKQADEPLITTVERTGFQAALQKLLESTGQ